MSCEDEPQDGFCFKLLANPQTSLSLVDSTQAKDRVYALETLSEIFNNICVEQRELPHHLPRDDSLKIAISFAILTRCDDISPVVRTKALTVLFQNIKDILPLLEVTKELVLESEKIEDLCQVDMNLNGNHRVFWYLLNTFEERQKELNAVLHRRINDCNVAVRKAAVSAFENLILSDGIYATKCNLKSLESASKDTSCSIRRHTIQSLYVILNAYKDNCEIQLLWLRCILPLISDPEEFVQVKALALLEDIFLVNIFSSNQEERRYSMTLLKELAAGDFLQYHKFFKMAIFAWTSTNKLTSETIDQLAEYVGTSLEECTWFYVSYFSLYSPVSSIFLHSCIDILIASQETGIYPPFIEHILKVMQNAFHSLSSEILDTVKSMINNGLETFSIPVELLPLYIDVLLKIHRHKGTFLEFDAFASATIQKCQGCLSDIFSVECPHLSLEDFLARCFSTATEFCQIYPSNISQNLIDSLKSFSGFIESPMHMSSILSPWGKAHAFAALGKMCLQDENLSHELFPMFAGELLKTENGVVRSNASIILIDLCRRYSSFADKCIPLITLCFKDELPLIRYQTIVSVVNLIQNDYIRWQGSLFFGLLCALNDKKEAIRDIAEYSLLTLLPAYRKTLFLDSFVESIFVLNCFSPPNYEQIAQSVRNFQRFAIPGEKRRGKRMNLYGFLLKSMGVKEKAFSIKLIAAIFVNIAESVYPLDNTTECIIRDCFAILTTDEIRTNDPELIENIDAETESELHKTELNIRKVILVDTIVPAVIRLKTSIVDPKSDLTRDIILFLKAFLHDFTDDVKEILADDKMLQKQLELEIKVDGERERQRISRNRNILEGKTQQQPMADSSAALTLYDIQKMMENTNICLQSDNNLRKRKQNSDTAASPESMSKMPRLATVPDSIEIDMDQSSTDSEMDI